LFSSDNGPQLGGQGDQCLDRFNANFNGAKGNVFEGGIRVPAILRWPAGLDRRRQVHAMVHFSDWLPTLLAIAGLDTPRHLSLDGQNVLPLLRGEPGQGVARRFWQWNRYTPVITSNAAMRDGAWKLIRPVIPEAMRVAPADGEMDRRLKYQPEGITDISRDPEPERQIPPPPPPLLFNIDEDPYERSDRAAEQPERVAIMLSEIENWFASVEADRHSIRDDGSA
jgi:arylsulfatase A-like enzyme